MSAILFFAPIYLFGVYAFWQHAWSSAVHVDDDGNPITAKIIPFPPRKGEASQFHFHCQDDQGLKLSVQATHPSKGGNA